MLTKYVHTYYNQAVHTQIRFNEDKNLVLKETRGVCFDDVISAIENDQILADLTHHNDLKYKNQRLLVVSINEYAYVIPYVIETISDKKREIFFKTVFPSRKFTKEYLK